MVEQRNGVTIHRAAWVVPIETPPVQDGAVAVWDRTILGVGRFRDLEGSWLSPSSPVVDHGDVALLPAAVNAHTHLELTALGGTIPLPQEGFSSWVQEVFRHRPGLDAASAEAGFWRGLAALEATGSSLCGDITNGGFLSSDTRGRYPERLPFLELIGFDCDSLLDAIERMPGSAPDPAELERDGVSLAAHSAYSTSAPLIEQAKQWCRARGKVFSMHVAEHELEMEFLRTGGGYCRELLQALGRWVDGWVPPRVSPVAYLDSLGVLDARTLLVHAVHLSRADWETVALRGCRVCFCPRSNDFLGSGKADVARALRMGIPATLGTDSLASNRDLNLFAEAAFLLDHWPDVAPDAVLTMMTLGGAGALGCQARLGSLAPGKSAAIIVVPIDPDVSAGRLSERIIHKAKEGAVSWAVSLKSA